MSLPETIQGKVWVFGDDVDTDRILPGKYLRLLTREELAPHAMEGLDPDFATSVKQGDIIVAGENVGCGSSREAAPQALIGCGIAAIVAASFGRIFYRNALNLGLPLVVCPEIGGKIQTGDTIEISLKEGKLIVESSKEELDIEPLPGVLQDILDAGGLVEWVKGKVE